MIEQFDTEEGYCRKLGHHLNFQYCRTERNGKPCTKIYDCWFEKFDIAVFMQEHYSEADIDALNRIPSPKANTILELIWQAQEHQKRQKHTG